jgi:hypothetical protein
LPDRLSGSTTLWADFPGLADELIDRHIELSLTRLAPLLSSERTTSEVS